MPNLPTTYQRQRADRCVPEDHTEHCTCFQHFIHYACISFGVFFLPLKLRIAAIQPVRALNALAHRWPSEKDGAFRDRLLSVMLLGPIRPTSTREDFFGVLKWQPAFSIG